MPHAMVFNSASCLVLLAYPWRTLTSSVGIVQVKKTRYAESPDNDPFGETAHRPQHGHLSVDGKDGRTKLIRKEEHAPSSVIIDGFSNFAEMQNLVGDTRQKRDADKQHVVWDASLGKRVLKHNFSDLETEFVSDRHESQYLFRRRRAPPTPPPPPPPINCEWSPWGSWSECSATCGEGEHLRKRDIAVSAQFDGRDCKGNTVKSQSCFLGGCEGPTTTTAAPKTTGAAVTQADGEQEKGKSNTLMYILIGVGAVVVLGIGVGAFCMFSRKKIQMRKRRGPALDGNDPFAEVNEVDEM